MKQVQVKRSLTCDEECRFLSWYADAYADADYLECRVVYRRIVELTGNIHEADRIMAQARKMAKQGV